MSVSPIPILGQLRPLLALGEWLMDNHYSPSLCGKIVSHTAAQGTPTGCLSLDPEDEQTATEVFVEAMAEVPQDDPAWDDHTFVLDAELLAEGTHPWPYPAIGDDDRSIPPDAAPAPPELDPDDAPYLPTDEDLEDYAAWLATIERVRDAALGRPISGGAPFVPSSEDWDDVDAAVRADDARRALRGE